jgi:hypothetical protein
MRELRSLRWPHSACPGPALTPLDAKGFYVELVEDRPRRPAHGATAGLLLCTDRNDRVARYALASSNQPVAIASYDLLPAAERAALPSEADIQRMLETPDLGVGGPTGDYIVRPDAAPAPEKATQISPNVFVQQ